LLFALDGFGLAGFLEGGVDLADGGHINLLPGQEVGDGEKLMADSNFGDACRAVAEGEGGSPRKTIFTSMPLSAPFFSSTGRAPTRPSAHHWN
jgi:hypothetical protein